MNSFFEFISHMEPRQWAGLLIIVFISVPMIIMLVLTSRKEKIVIRRDKIKTKEKIWNLDKVCVKINGDEDAQKIREMLPKYNQELWRIKAEFDFMGKIHKVESPGLTITWDDDTDWYLQYYKGMWHCYPYNLADQIPITIEQLEQLLKDGEITLLR